MFEVKKVIETKKEILFGKTITSNQNTNVAWVISYDDGMTVQVFCTDTFSDITYFITPESKRADPDSIHIARRMDNNDIDVHGPKALVNESFVNDICNITTATLDYEKYDDISIAIMIKNVGNYIETCKK